MADNTSKFKTCHKTAAGNIITAKGRLSYPHLFKAVTVEGEKDQTKARFQATMLFPKDADLALLQAAVDECAEAKWGSDWQKKHKVKRPFLKTSDYPKQAALEKDYPVFIRTNTTSRPEVRHPNMQRVGDEQQHEVYPGRWALLSVRPYAYEFQGVKGISFGLGNVQLLDHDEPFSAVRASADDEFEPIDIAGNGTTDNIFD
jgi:hypothetical protein